MAKDAVTETQLNILAQHFYDAAGLNILVTSKPNIVEGLRAVFREVGVRVAQPEPEGDALAVDVDGDVWQPDGDGRGGWYCSEQGEYRPWDELACRAPLKIYRMEKAE